MHPREDKCRFCGVHIGWALGPIGEMLMLGLCDKPECQEKSKQERRIKNNGHDISTTKKHPPEN